jgi:hypothetical protein
MLSPVALALVVGMLVAIAAAVPLAWGWRLDRDLERTRRALAIEREMRLRYQREAYGWRELYPGPDGRKTTVWRHEE